VNLPLLRGLRPGSRLSFPSPPRSTRTPRISRVSRDQTRRKMIRRGKLARLSVARVPALRQDFDVCANGRQREPAERARISRMIHRGCASCVSLHAFARVGGIAFSRRKLRWKLAARACDFTGHRVCPCLFICLHLAPRSFPEIPRRVSRLGDQRMLVGGANALNSGEERPRNADIFTSRFIDRPTNTTINCIHVHVTYRPRARARTRRSRTL